jgi:hypothetical protein
MAENKKSIVVYADWESTFEQLSNEEAGKLIKHFFEYVNDKNPSLDDRLLKIAFEPIKQQLKRDLKKWDNSKKEKSNNGRLGNLKRWNKDLYDQVISEIITIDDAEIIAKDRKAIKDVANIAVNVNVDVNDTVIKKEKEKSFPIMPKMEDVGELPKVKIESAIEQIAITTQQNVSEKQIILFWEAWKKQKLTGEKYYAGLHEVYSHFINCAKKEKFTNQIRAPEKKAPDLRTADYYLK